jgi:hypothetical protein
MDAFLSDLEADALADPHDEITYTYDQIDLDQVIMAVDAEGIRKMLGLYTQLSSFTTRAGCRYPWLRDTPLLSSQPTIRMIAPERANQEVIATIRQVLADDFGVLLHDTHCPDMLLTSRMHSVWTDSVIRACISAGVTTFVFIVYGQKQMLRCGTGLLDEINLLHGQQILGEDPPTSMIIDLARTNASQNLLLLRASDELRSRVSKLESYEMFWTKFGGLSFEWEGLRFKYYITIVHQLKSAIKQLDQIPRQVVTYQRRGEILKDLWLR